MNRDVHSSPAMHKVEGKTHKFLEKLKIASGKSTLFGSFFVKFFQITFVHKECKIAVTSIALQPCIRWKEKHIFFGEIEDTALKINLILTFFCEIISDHLFSYQYFSKYK